MLKKIAILAMALWSANAQFIRSPYRSSKVLTVLPKVALPKAHFWGDVDGKNYLTVARNQHIPQYCGSCWAFASTSAMSDRIKIMRNAQWPDINIAPQVLVSCERPDNGCEGGDANTAYAYIHKNNITDETCSPYQARGWTNGNPCTAKSICQTCDENGCRIPEKYNTYTVKEYGAVKGEENIMNEILQRGPVACSIYATETLDNFKGGSIYREPSDRSTWEPNHEISIVGWGEEDGQKYWVIRNSWGNYWADDGFFRLARGEDMILIEDDCWYAVPENTWDSQDKTSLSTVATPSATEDSFDWRNKDGKNYLSWNRNQQSPHFCKSSWAFAVTSAVSDRINIAQGDAFQQVALSPQVLVNCQVGGGSCEQNANIYAVYAYGMQNGFVDDTCQNYMATDSDQPQCAAIDQCMNCVPPVRDTKCFPVDNYKKWMISSFDYLWSVQDIKDEIKNYGPVTCTLVPTQGFKDYKGGLYKEETSFEDASHHVSVVGWGTQEGQAYWIVRNSWGTSWGDYGFMLLAQGSLQVEQQCTYGRVSLNTPRFLQL